MREEDFTAVLRAIQQELQLAGLPELARVDYYEREGERITDPRGLAVEMLNALDRHLSTLDPKTYRNALTKIRKTLNRRATPRGVVIEMDEAAVDQPEQAAELRGPPIIELSRLPRLMGLRSSLRRLAAELGDTRYDEPPSSRAR
jgi:hypothetical protein